MYFQEQFLDQNLAEYLEEHNLKQSGDMDPDQFSSWIFPKLLEHRKPLYESIAEKYGYTVELHEVAQVRDEKDFMSLICDAINRK